MESHGDFAVSFQGIQWPVALALLQGSSSRSAVLLTALSAACAAAAVWPRALELANEALVKAKEDADERGMAVAFGAALKACERGAQWQLAAGIFQGSAPALVSCWDVGPGILRMK
eukprot:s594_g23.t1